MVVVYEDVEKERKLSGGEVNDSKLPCYGGVDVG